MNAPTPTGLRLESSDGGPAFSELDDVCAALAPFGSRVWPFDLGDVPESVRARLDRPTLDEAEAQELLDHFVLSRARLLEVIRDAGRSPQVPGGGSLTSTDETHSVHYPQLYIAAPDADYSRFDRLHSNLAADGTGVDETLQLVSGGGVRIVLSRPDLGEIALFLDLPDPARGWLVSYEGAHGHIGSLSDARPGTKLVVQIIGPAHWEMRYDPGA